MKHLFLAAFSFLTFNTCQSLAGVYLLPGRATNKIEVCFESRDDGTSSVNSSSSDDHYSFEVRPKDRTFSEWSVNLKGRVKSLVNSEYSVEKTNVEFVGWTDCTLNTSRSTARIFISTSNLEKVTDENNGTISIAGESSVGENTLSPENANKSTFVYFLHPDVISKSPGLKKAIGDTQGYWEAVVVHEFGHLAGLYHEQEQTEMATDPNCKKFYKESFDQMKEIFAEINVVRLPEYVAKYVDHPEEARIGYGYYDPKSVMNYCNLNRYSTQRFRPQQYLSDQDRKTLKELYNYVLNK